MGASLYLRKYRSDLLTPRTLCYRAIHIAMSCHVYNFETLQLRQTEPHVLPSHHPSV
jgi:hypothetical protein